jgi:cell division protein DivIC
MTKKKRKRKASKSKLRIFICLIIFASITGTLAYDCISNIRKINEMKKEKKNLQEELIVLQEEKEILETDILRLKDPDYIAKYVREKYFYSKDGELILRLD